MEKVGKKKTVKRVAALLLTMLMLVGCLPLAFAEGSGLMPDPVHYTNGKEVTDGSTGDIVLSKTAERIGPDEWKVKVEAEIERTVGRPQPNLELVVVLDKSGSMAWCTDEFAHAAGSHSEHSVDNGCYTLICTNTGGGHRHSVYNGCYELNCTRPFVKHTTSGNTLCSYRQGSNWVNYTPNRLAVAKSNITSLVNSLNASNNIEEKEIEYVVFSDNAQKVTNLNNVQARGGTSMYTGIQKGLTLFDQDDSYRKILIVVTDGEASDGDLKEHTLELLDEAKEEKNIAVFTVGFSYENEDLSAIAGNGGSYVHAGNQVELEKAFQGIEETIRAMMVDPMGTTVGFDSSSFDVSTSEVKGNVSYVGNTLYWNPVGDSVPAGSKVSYSYTVKLNHKADTSRGSHTGVALNAPTDFLYSITNGTTVSHYAVGFPIPEASYKISTLKERWVNEYNRSILSDSDEEKIITDYSKTTDDGVHKVYTPAFTTDYNHPVQSIPVTSSNSKFYLYKYSTVTKNNVALENGVDDIKPKNEAAAYVVTHHYEKVDGYKVSYTYEGEVPDTAVAASSFNTMAQAGATVQVAENPSAGGYRFLGWECETSDVSVSGGAFTMPSKHVSFVGKWEKVHSYQVNANYFYVIDGDYSMPMQENTSEILLEHVNCENGNTTSYTLPVDAFIYNDNTYTSVQLGSAVSGVTISDNVINGIVPGSGTVPKIVVNLYRDIKRDYELNVKHVFKDNTTHEGYPFAYPDVGSKYQYDQPWDVSNLGAPEGYALVVSESGVATSATNDTLMKARVLKEDTFGKADKYVILTYEKLPMYQVTIHFVSEEPTKARLIAEDYVSDPAYAGTTYDVRAQLPSYIEDGDVFWYYSGDESLSGDPLTDTLDSNKDITAEYYLKPTYTITATYTTVTDGVSSSEVVTSSGKDEVDVPVPFTQSDYDNKVTGFTEKHFQNDLKVNGVDATTMPTMEKFGHYEVTLSYLRQVNNPYRAVVKYQDQNGNELKDPATSDEIAFGQSYNMETAKLETIVADGVKYLFVSDDTEANKTAYSGNMPKGGVQIIRTYQPAPKYTVTYQYSNTIEGAPALPEDETYYEGDTVTVKNAVSKDGYTFSGWSTTDATIAAGEFAMPNKNVVLVGSWTEKDRYRVTIHFVSEEPTKARLIAEDYVSDPAYAGTTYDVRAQLPSYIEDGDVFWYYSGDESLSGDPLTDTLDSNKDITAEYYLKPTYTITATYTTVTDGVSSSEVVTSSGKDEVDVPVPFTQSDYDNKVTGFTEKHFQNDLKVNGVDATTMPTMEKFGHYEVTLSYLRQVNNPYRAVVKYQDQNGNELKDPVKSEEIIFGRSYNMETAKLETIEADGVKYLFVSDDTKENKTAYSGTMPKGGVEIIRTYQPAPKYTITYQYSNTIEGAPALPEDETYYEGDTVTVKNAVSKDGYTFSGWSTTDATIAAGEFAMPNKNVVLVGSWTEKDRYRVTIHFVSEEPTKARLIAEDYVSDPAYAGTTYDVRAQLPSYIEDGDVFWYYSGDESLSGDPLTDTLDSNKDITAEYYLKPTYTITATYTTVTDGVSSSEVVTSSGKDEVDVPVPFTQSDYDNKVTGFTEKHFQNDLKVNGVDATTMPTMEKFGHYEVTLSYLRQVNNPYRAVVKYQDQNGNELKDPATSDEIAFGQSYNMETAKLETIVADGVKYLFVSDDTDANNTAYFGNMPKGGVEIIRTYQPAPKYTVTYQYSNTFEGAPTLPVDENTYYEGEIVAVKDAVSKEGYTFSGWSTTDATIADGKLSMPGKNVVLVGSWTKKPSYQVIVHYYTITDGVKASTPDQTVDTGIQYCDTTSPVTVPYETTVSSVEYSSPKLAENTAGATLDKTNRQVINITPVTETAKVVVELTRTVTSSAEYKVVHQYYTVDPDLVETKTEQDVTETFTGSHQQTINAADVADHVIGKYERVSDSGSIVLDKDEPRTIIITYKQYQYRVTIDGDEGVEIISGKSAAEGGTIHDRGEDVAVSFQIKDGYLLTGMKVDEHELRNGSNVVSFPAISENHQVVLTTSLRQKGVATVHFVDEEGNLLKDSLISEELYIGDEFDVSQALEVEKITLGNSEYAFDRHFQKRNMVRSTNGLMTVEDVDYIGQMPAGGVEIIRVYKLDKVACYYQVKKVFTGYDAEGAVVYSAMEESAVTETGNLSETITLPETSNHSGYGFRLVSDAVMTGDLTGSTKEAPYVFVAYYEVRQEDEPVPGTQLPPGLTPPSKPDSSSGSATGAESLPPSTGDAGVAHWAVLMVLAAAGLLMMFAKRKA